jgi:putative flippase GtrA
LSIQGLIGELSRNWRAHRTTFSLYLVSGGLTLAFYILTLVLLIEVAGLSQGLAAGTAMLLGGVVNYLLNKWVVFRSTRHHFEAAPRYVIVLLANAGANAAVTWLASDVAGLPYGLVQVVYLTAATVTVFLVMRRWVMFRGQPSASDQS